MRYVKTLGIYEHDFNFFLKQKYVHTNGTGVKIFHIFTKFFFKSVPDVIHTFMRLSIMYWVTNGSKEACFQFARLNCEYSMSYGRLYMHIPKKAFFIHQKQRIFYQIIYLAKNKGFSTKSPKCMFLLRSTPPCPSPIQTRGPSAIICNYNNLNT